ncbi:hypothetical protein VTN96DRAFT_8425 [Rasamsonia emersonii]
MLVADWLWLPARRWLRLALPLTEQKTSLRSAYGDDISFLGTGQDPLYTYASTRAFPHTPVDSLPDSRSPDVRSDRYRLSSRSFAVAVCRSLYKSLF